MSRGLVGASFALAALATLAQAVEYLGDAVAEPSGRAWLVGGLLGPQGRRRRDVLLGHPAPRAGEATQP